jgi:hypothetical protein
VADLAFADGALYALLAGAGCSHGRADADSGIVRVNADGSTTKVANLSPFIQGQPGREPAPGRLRAGPQLVLVRRRARRPVRRRAEPQRGRPDRPATGAISRVADVSGTHGYIVPTALAYKGERLPRQSR